MPFFPEIDEVKTKKNADRILRGYKRWRRVAGESSDQRLTQQLTFMPRSPHSTPSKPIERLAIRKIDAELEMEAIEQAISGLYEPEYRYILTHRYIVSYPKTNFEIAAELGYEKSRYAELLSNALLAFAEIYRHGEQVVEIGNLSENYRTKNGL